MRILFTSDLHGSEPAYLRFVEVLEQQDFDLGIISGNLMEDGMNPEEITAILGIDEDELLPELPDADDTFEEAMNKAIASLHDPGIIFHSVPETNPSFCALSRLVTGVSR